MVCESKAAVRMKEPYLPGFLAFREVDFLLERLREVQKKQPHSSPQVLYTCIHVHIHSPVQYVRCALYMHGIHVLYFCLISNMPK